MLRAIIVEDEFYASEMLKQKIADGHPDVEVVAVCGTAEDGLLSVLQERPDLLFLDIQLPQKNGVWLAFELHERTNERFTPPAIIFTSAYSDSSYLTDAFRVAAIDYLIKPFPAEDLSRAIDRVRRRHTSASNIPDLLNAVNASKMLAFRNYNGVSLLRPDDILYVEADGHYSKIVQTDGRELTVFESIGEVEQKLAAEVFFRAGRSLIINRLFIRTLNTRKNAVRLASPLHAIDIAISDASMKALRKEFD